MEEKGGEMAALRGAVRRGLLLVASVLFVVELAVQPLGVSQGASAGPLTGQEVYERYCLVCHGERGEGVAGYTPSLKPILRSRSDDQLRQAIRDGRPGTEMPAWGTLLNRDEIEGVLQFLRGWGSQE